MHFAVSDVVKNIRYFLGVVKRATGNIRDPQADGNKKETSQKPGMSYLSLALASLMRVYSQCHHSCPSEHPTGTEYTDLGRINVDGLHSSYNRQSCLP